MRHHLFSLSSLPPPGVPIALTSHSGELPTRYLGPAAAGFPSPAADWEEATISLVAALNLDRADSFVFRLSGHSMHDAGLYDDDLLVVDRAVKPKNGDIVVAVADGGFVCRQLCVRRATPYLEARTSSASYEPRVCDEDVEIFGVVRASVRRLAR